jgi:hypothetical protein
MTICANQWGKLADKQDVPPEALPSTLKSAYGKEATPAPDASLEPSHETGMASTSMDPPHNVLTEQAKQGTLADRNPPPEPKAGYVFLLSGILNADDQ